MILFTPALHAGMLSFVHPITREVVRFTAPLHQPMLDLVRKLRQLHNHTILDREAEYSSRLKQANVAGDVDLFT